MAIEKLFVDMDGVLVDFNGGVAKEFGIDLSHNYNWHFNYKEMFGLTRDEFWKSLSNDFWANLEPLPWIHEMLAMLEGYRPCLLSAPALDTASGKQRWIKKHLPEYWRMGRYLLGPAKHYCACPGAVLIDDKEDNVLEFRDRGGQAILFPAMWNSLRHMSHNPLPIVYGGLTKIVCGEV